ncbi:AI-2E family transporter [Halobacterium wangiae]|uniref:AI-2E family transporter n=1 Tax=Halobacterium wangiae TaxID=2902623 RepID=UPI001E543B4B|nr:AI-2E family transporter [Halobacterium wangiae]
MDWTRGFLLAVVLVLLVASVFLVLPFLNYFLLSVFLGFVLMPLQTRLETVTKPSVAAGTIVLLTSVVIILPLLYVLRIVLVEGTTLLERIQAGELDIAGVERSIQRLTGEPVDIAGGLRSAASDVGPGAFDSILGLLGTVTHTVIGVGLALFLLYYFLRDADTFERWLRARLPLPEHVQDELHSEFRNILWAVLLGHVFVAAVQGGIAGIGLVVTGIPNAFFWTAVMIVLSLLPIVGSFLVWGPASVYLFLVNDPIAALGLFVYGTIVVGISDDYLRPIVVDHYAQLNPSIIIIGVLGGIYVIGFMGIFFGPIVIGSLKAALDVFHSEHGMSL